MKKKIKVDREQWERVVEKVLPGVGPHMEQGEVTGNYMLEGKAINNFYIENFTYMNLRERQTIVAKIDQILDGNTDWKINYNALEKFVEKAKMTFDSPEDQSKYQGKELLISLVLNAVNQFCFWYDPNDQKKRTLSSGDFWDVNLSTIRDVIDKAVTLRYERKMITKEILDAYDDALNGSHSFTSFLHGILTNSFAFNSDFFKKKKNLLFMLMVRSKKQLGLDDIGMESMGQFIKSINPAIDYQIPRMLRGYGIIQCINPNINPEGILVKDSIEEITLRAICYKILIKIQDDHNIDQTTLDWILWSKRNEDFKNVKHHCTLTTDY